MTEKDIARFWEKVNKDGPIPDPVKYPELKTRCWVWTACRVFNGYGRFGISDPIKHVELAHRMSYKIEIGVIEDGFYVLHRCDNPICVNPNHLFTGTQKQNISHMVSKHRGRVGSQYEHSKLNEATVELILKMRKETGASHKEIGMKFNVPRRHVGKIIGRAIWRHVISG